MGGWEGQSGRLREEERKRVGIVEKAGWKTMEFEGRKKIACGFMNDGDRLAMTAAMQIIVQKEITMINTLIK